MARAETRIPRYRAPSHRSAPEQQGARRARPVRRDPHPGPAEARRCLRGGGGARRACSGSPDQVNTGEEPQKAGVVPADAPALIAMARDEPRVESERSDVHPACRFRAGAAFRAIGQDRAGAWNAASQHGDERGFRDRDPLRRHACAGRQRAVRRAQSIGGERRRRGPCEAAAIGIERALRDLGVGALRLSEAVSAAMSGVGGGLRRGIRGSGLRFGWRRRIGVPGDGRGAVMAVNQPSTVSPKLLRWIADRSHRRPRTARPGGRHRSCRLRSSPAVLISSPVIAR